MAIKVTLRQKPISGNRKSLYLDFYPPIKVEGTDKETRREFLNLYLYQGAKTPVDKLHNKETLSSAEFIRQKRHNELNKPEIYSGQEKEQLRLKEIGSQSFLAYFQKLTDKKEGSTRRVWQTVLMNLKKFTDDGVKFSDIDEKFCNDYREFLLTEKLTREGTERLSQNTVVVYFSKFRTAIRQAYKDRLLQWDFNANVATVKKEETRRTVLTLDEVNALIQSECPLPILKKAAIFSIYTGLRFSDIQKLTWSEIEELSPGNVVINFQQKKTKGIETLPIAYDALAFIGERRNATDKVFEGLLYSTFYNKVLAKWVGLAGINKDITFHSFRHTYATLQLSLGTDIYTVSKLLGHRDVKTTQIYAKMIDENKRTAANRLQFNIKSWK